MMVYFLFFSEQMGRIPRDSYQYNLMPFAEIRRYFQHVEKLGGNLVLLNLVGNVVCFMPFGFVIPVLTVRYRSAWKMVILTFFASLLVETIQLFSKLGIFDVDDILLNTLGGLMGYLLFRICIGMMHRWNRRGKK